MRRDPRLLAVVVLVVVAAATIWAQLSQPEAVKAVVAKPQPVPITEQTLVCPQAGGTPSAGAAHIAYADADTDPASAANSTLTATPLDPDGVPSPIDVKPGHAWNVDGPKTVGPMRLSVTGPLARTVSAVQFTRQTISGSLQVSNAPCEAPTTDAWFAGFSSGVGAHATLLLSNVDSVPATVDIGIFGDSAPPNPNAEHGLVVAPQTQAAVQLDSLTPGFANAVVHVSASSGRVVPAVRYDAENGSIPLGVEWIPRTEAPALEQTVPGILDGDGTRRLVLAAPGELDATVSLKLVTADGSFTPTGFDDVNVPAGGVTSVDLAPGLQKDAAAVVVTSTEPVVVAAVSSLPPDKAGGTDVGFTAAVPALTGPAVVAGGETGADRHTRLLLSAPDDDAQLTLTLLPSSASSSPLVSPLTVPGGTTLTLDLASLSNDPSPAIELNPERGGPVYAAWTLQEVGKTSTDLTSFPVRNPVSSLERPPVKSDLVAGLPGYPAPPAPSSPSLPAPVPSAPASSPDDVFPSDSFPAGPDPGSPGSPESAQPPQPSSESSSQPSP
ncbi:MAG: DUF5719 family protein [Acidothermaceae bacterium]